jgi:hypothetical protein
MVETSSSTCPRTRCSSPRLRKPNPSSAKASRTSTLIQLRMQRILPVALLRSSVRSHLTLLPSQLNFLIPSLFVCLLSSSRSKLAPVFLLSLLLPVDHHLSPCQTQYVPTASSLAHASFPRSFSRSGRTHPNLTQPPRSLQSPASSPPSAAFSPPTSKPPPRRKRSSMTTSPPATLRSRKPERRTKRQPREGRRAAPRSGPSMTSTSAR